MPTYPVINQKTKEKKELSMTMKQYDEWRNAPENADWDKDWHNNDDRSPIKSTAPNYIEKNNILKHKVDSFKYQYF